MSTHPLSIYKQILYSSSDIIDARLEYKNHWIIIYIKTIENLNTDALKIATNKLVQFHKGFADQYSIIFNWVDGPKYPEKFNKLDSYEFSLIESCSGISDEIESLLYKAYDFIHKVYISTLAAGVVGFEIVTKDNQIIEPKLLERLQNFCELLFPPMVKVKIKTIEHEKDVDTKQNNIIGISQPTKNSIRNKLIISLFEEGEDLFRKSLDVNFQYDTFAEKFDVNEEQTSILLPLGSKINLRSLLPFYEKIYFTVPLDGEEIENSFFGCKYSEILTLIEKKRLIPLFTHTYPRYTEKIITDFTEFNNYISPQHLSSLLASDYTKQNPLWLVSQKDYTLAKHFLDNIRKEILANKIEPSNLDLIHKWIDFQIDGLIDFSRMLINQGSLVPIYFGSGALLSNFISSKNSSKDIPELELKFGGMEIAHASAINSICYPMQENNIHMYEVLSSFHSNYYLKNKTEFPLLINLEEILQSIEIACPEKVPILEWESSVNTETIKKLRKVLKKYFSKASSKDLTEIRKTAEKLNKEVNELSQRIDRYNTLISRFDILSPITEYMLTYNDSNIPYLGWIIGILIKENVPKIWDSLEYNSHMNKIKEIVEGLGTLKNPNIVALHKIKEQLNNKK